MRKHYEVPFDQFQRYEICRRIIDGFSSHKGEKVKVLDVGGFFIGPEGKPLLPGVEFLTGHDVLVIDTIDAEVEHYLKSDGRNLPFEDNSFDFVISNDALEHVHPYDREKFILELKRVSSKYVLLNFPYYTTKTALAEKILYEYLVDVLKIEHEMLSEHIQYGLPSVDSIKQILHSQNLNYACYFSGDIDNWMYLMILRHELLSKKAGALVNYIDSYFNQYHFDSEMNLKQGYRMTVLIAKNDDIQLLGDNFFTETGLKEPLKVQIPFSPVIDLYRLRALNEEKEVFDKYYSEFTTITPRMSKDAVIAQSFQSNQPNLHKIGLLAATYKEPLKGYARIQLIDEEKQDVFIDQIINLDVMDDNEWYFLEFPPLFNSLNRWYVLKIEHLSEAEGCSFYMSEKYDYGILTYNGQPMNGNLSLKLIVRDTNNAEKIILLEQDNIRLSQKNGVLHADNLELINKLSVVENNVTVLLREIEEKAQKINDLINEMETKDLEIRQLHDGKANADQINIELNKSITALSCSYKELVDKLLTIENSEYQLKELRTILDEKEKQYSETLADLTKKNLEKENQYLEKITDLTKKQEQLSNELTVVYNTVSWKATLPLRWATHKRRQFIKLIRGYVKFTRKNGGLIIGTFKIPVKGIRYAKQFGVSGLFRRIREYSPGENMSLRPVIMPSTHFGGDIDVYPVVEPQIIPPHTASVDIVICVHNALEDVKRCLSSILQHTKPPYQIILVDDGSGKETADYLNGFATTQNAILIRNNEAKGYTLAANIGLRKSTGDYVVLLNSDTIVTDGWIDKLIGCAASDETIGIVGPLSNTASWQSIPELLVDGDWADNELPEDTSINQMAAIVTKASKRLYPRIPFLNGFCLMIKRGIIEKIGYFDEETFGRGYGEENDYCIRVRKAGYELAVADDVYIYHAQSKSYSHERRKQLAQHADKVLAEKHGQDIISSGAESCRYDRVMEGIRARSKNMRERNEYIRRGKQKFEGALIYFILPVTDAGGGSNVVIQEADAMLDMGIDVRIINLKEHREKFESSYSQDHFRVPVIYIEDLHEIDQLASNADAIIATAFQTVEWMKDCSVNGQPVRGYYIQDFEPYFFEKGSMYYEHAWNSYDRFPDLVRVTKTEWNQREVKKQIGVNCNIIGPSVNLDLFRPRRRQDHDWPNRPLRVAAMIRPSTPRRNPAFTMEVLKEVHHTHGDNIEIILFGCATHEADFQQLNLDFKWKNAGVLTRKELAYLLNEIDIFVDLSTFQAMGLTAMEAMACGVSVIVPKQGGATSFIRHNENGIIIDSADKVSCIKAINRLIYDQDLRSRLQRQAIYDISGFYSEKSAYKLVESLLGNR